MEQNQYVGESSALTAEDELMEHICDIHGGFLLEVDQSIAEYFQSTDTYTCTAHICPDCRPGRSLVALVYKTKSIPHHASIENLWG